MKGKRQEKILEIIRTNDIETQEELTKKLVRGRIFFDAGDDFKGYS